MKTKMIIAKVDFKKTDATALQWATLVVGAICSLVIFTVAWTRGVESIGAGFVITAVVSLGLSMWFGGKVAALSEIKREIIEEIAIDSLEAAEGSDE